MLCGANDPEERAEHTEQGEGRNSDSTSGLRLSLDGEDGVNLGQFDELQDCLADKRDRGSSEGGLRNVSIRFECLFLLGICGLLNLGFDVEGLLSERLGVGGGVADIDVAEEDIFGHRPELDTDTADPMKGLNGGLVLKEAGVGDLAGGPGTLVRRVINERSEPFALIVRVGLCRTKASAKSAKVQQGLVRQRTASKDRIQQPLRTWDSLQYAGSSHHPRRRPTPRASQPGDQERTQARPRASHRALRHPHRG